MRPVRLTMQALGPYAGREVVDFRDAVAAGLFGIYGQTGAGKSTIFSAMTFALFGEAARPEQDIASLRSDHAEPDLPTEVELIFEVGERRYVVRRQPEQMRPKRRGGGETQVPHEAYLFDATGLALEDISQETPGKVVAEKKVGAVRSAIAEILGYGAAEFRQIVLLPQGKFEAFLTAARPELAGSGRIVPVGSVWAWERSACCLWDKTESGFRCEDCSLWSPAERQARYDRVLAEAP